MWTVCERLDKSHELITHGASLVMGLSSPAGSIPALLHQQRRNMKTLKRQGEIVRVPEETVDILLKNGWEFCSKQEWKENVRDNKGKK